MRVWAGARQLASTARSIREKEFPPLKVPRARSFHATRVTSRRTTTGSRRYGNSRSFRAIIYGRGKFSLKSGSTAFAGNGRHRANRNGSNPARAGSMEGGSSSPSQLSFLPSDRGVASRGDARLYVRRSIASRSLDNRGGGGGGGGGSDETSASRSIRRRTSNVAGPSGALNIRSIGTVTSERERIALDGIQRICRIPRARARACPRAHDRPYAH